MNEAKALIGELVTLRGKLLAILDHTVPGGNVNLKVSDLQGFKNLVCRAADMIGKQSRKAHHLEIEMARAADAIGKLQSQLSSVQSNLNNTQDSLLSTQSQLTTAQANAYDAADLAAIQSVLGTPTPAGTTNAPIGQIDLNSPTSNGSGGTNAS
jgi:hypothetical protein